MTALVERLVPDRFRDTAERERHARLLVILILVTAGFSAFYFAVSWWVRHPPGMAAMTWNVVGYTALLPALRSGLPLRVAGNVFVFIAFAGIAVCVGFQGGLVSPVLPWFVLPALVAILLVGPKAGLVWTGLCTAAVVAFGAVDLGGVDLPIVVDPARRAVLDISSPAGLVLIVISVAYALEVGRRAEAARVLHRNEQLAETLDQLQRTQDQLVQSEKLASLSTVTSGVAHEIQNPLNFVTNFAALQTDLVAEVREALTEDPSRPAADALKEAEDALTDLSANAEKILGHGQRARDIVRSMLLVTRGTSAPPAPTDLNALVERTAVQALDGWLARHGGPPPALDLDLGADVGTVPLSPLDIDRAVTNLVANALDAVQERAREGTGPFEPRVRVSTRRRGEVAEIRVADNGGGIAADDRDRVFEPFYTTKPTGKGTGLGLALVHEVVVRRHGGAVELRPVSEGTVAVVRLPCEVAVDEPVETAAGGVTRA